MVVGWHYPGEMLIVATLLAIFPYLLIYGLVTRIALGSTTGTVKP